MAVDTWKHVPSLTDSVFNQTSPGPREQQHFRWGKGEKGFTEVTEKDSQSWKEKKSKRQNAGSQGRKASF